MNEARKRKRKGKCRRGKCLAWQCVRGGRKGENRGKNERKDDVNEGGTKEEMEGGRERCE